MLRFWMVLLVAASVLPAHDMFLVPAQFQVQPGQPLLITLHNGDGFPAGQGPVDPARIRMPRILTASKVVDLAGWQAIGQATHVQWIPAADEAFWVVVSTSPNSIEMKPAAFEGYLKEEGLTKVIRARQEAGVPDKPGREQYSKFAKVYVSGKTGREVALKPAGLTIEFVPSIDPATVKPGGKLPVVLLFRGQPLADAQVLRSTPGGTDGEHRVVGRTDANGRIEVPIVKSGAHRLHSIQMAANQGRAAFDWESFWASMTFEVGQ